MDNNKLLNELEKLGAVPEGWKEIEMEFIEFKVPGDFVKGKLLAKSRQHMKSGNDVGKYTILKDNHRATFNGTAKLDDLMSGVPLGSEVWVTFKGVQKMDKDQEMKLFTVYVK